MFWRTVRVACVLSSVAAVAAPACGGSSSNPGMDAGGSGGQGGSSGSVGRGGSAGAPPTMKCGSATCKAVTIPVPGNPFTIPPCCADEATSQCGLDSSVLAAFGPTFPVACQPLHQPGDLDDTTCPMSMKTPVQGSALEIQFAGCCRADHTCGYNLDTLASIVPLGLGCVDSAPFVDGGAPLACGGTTSSGGAAGAAGAGGASNEGGAAGGPVDSEGGAAGGI